MRIPRFKNTIEALRYGKKYYGDRKVIAALKRKRVLADREFNMLLDVRTKLTRYREESMHELDPQVKKMQEIALEGQLYREAYEMAEGTSALPKGVTI